MGDMAGQVAPVHRATLARQGVGNGGRGRAGVERIEPIVGQGAQQGGEFGLHQAIARGKAQQ
jgi:hypothetical protein